MSRLDVLKVSIVGTTSTVEFNRGLGSIVPPITLVLDIVPDITNLALSLLY